MNSTLLVYLVVFGLASVVSLLGVIPAERIQHPDTRRGLIGLLVGSGLWAASHVGFLAAPTPALQRVLYVAGLIVGLATVGPWLYFCSAYSGRTLHRNPTLRRVAVVVFLTIVAVKLTNPIHHLYFTAEYVTTPFPHLAVDNGIFHWLVMGLSYVLASIGYFMLLELFQRVSHNTRPLAGLLGLTGLPVVLDVLGLLSPALLDITYEPLGVAAFAVGVLFVYFERFQSIRIAGTSDDPVIVLDDAGRLRDFNESARSLFSELAESGRPGAPLDDVLPQLADAVESDRSIIERERAGSTRYYRITKTAFSTDASRLGTTLALTDITHREQYRKELERQNERLADFANMVSHDLRNPLNVAEGRIEMAASEYDSEHIDAAYDAIQRMDTIIDDVLALARQGQPIDETESVSIESVAEAAWNMVDTGDARLRIEGDITVEGDQSRVQQLLENLFRNAIEHGTDGARREADDTGTTGTGRNERDVEETGGADVTSDGTAGGPSVTVRIGPTDGAGFFVADDGPGIPPEDRERVFELGYTTAASGTGFGLAIVGEIADAHGWRVSVVESESGGARFEIHTGSVGTGD